MTRRGRLRASTHVTPVARMCVAGMSSTPVGTTSLTDLQDLVALADAGDSAPTVQIATRTVSTAVRPAVFLCGGTARHGTRVAGFRRPNLLSLELARVPGPRPATMQRAAYRRYPCASSAGRQPPVCPTAPPGRLDRDAAGHAGPAAAARLSRRGRASPPASESGPTGLAPGVRPRSRIISLTVIAAWAPLSSARRPAAPDTPPP
jgi:hypothetical protein